MVDRNSSVGMTVLNFLLKNLAQFSASAWGSSRESLVADNTSMFVTQQQLFKGNRNYERDESNFMFLMMSCPFSTESISRYEAFLHIRE